MSQRDIFEWVETFKALRTRVVVDIFLGVVDLSVLRLRGRSFIESEATEDLGLIKLLKNEPKS